MAKELIGIVMLGGCLLAAGCRKGPAYAGSVCGAQSISQSTKLQNCYVLQFDTLEGQPAEARPRPLFLIVWQAKRAGATQSDSRGLVHSIHDHEVHPSLTKPGVYALRLGYALKEIPLTDGDIEHLLTLAQAKDRPFAVDDVWQSKVSPHLSVMEDPAGGEPPPR